MFRGPGLTGHPPVCTFRLDCLVPGLGFGGIALSPYPQHPVREPDTQKSSRCCSQTRVSLRNHIQGPSQAVGHAVGAATEAQFQQLQTKQNTCVCVSEEHVLPLLPAWTGWVTWSASEFFRNCQTVFRHGCAIVPPTHDRQRGPSEKVPSMNQGVASPDIESARASILNFPSSAAVGMCVCCFYTTQATAFPDSSRGGESRCLCGTTLFVA
ncbi:uncharacterized protein [Symphalangus syndactylus]|uniref:uncharacterized protein isoform X3 n=1 Tax=Symphalangus syndactylus TaxID=9590 RepID=UPI0030073EA5